MARTLITYHCATKKKSGTRPSVIRNREIGAGMTSRSSSGNSAIVGPRVINRKSSDGGYFWQLKNEKHVRNALALGLHFSGSPYTSIVRSRKNAAVRDRPSTSMSVRRRFVSIV